MGNILVIGAGLREGELTLEAAKALEASGRILLHTRRIGCADYLERCKIAFESLDYLYDECEDFDEHAARAAEAVIRAAKDGDVSYVVYDVRDRSVQQLVASGTKCRIMAGPPVEGALFGLLEGGTRLLEASDWENFRLSPMENALIREINSRELASEVKLKLMECYNDEARAFLLSGDGTIARLPLYDLDRARSYDHRSCALIPAERELTRLQHYGFDELVDIMRILQGPGGCPWDKAQTHESLRPFMLEETYEAIDAINAGDETHLYEELGDILMQVVMHAEIARRHGEFEIGDVTGAICEKMIERHSHIFGGDRAGDPEAVLDLWARNKMKERGQHSYAESLADIPRSLPAAMRASKLADRTGRAGVRAKDISALVGDMLDQAAALAAAPSNEEKLGNLLFAACALARAAHVDPEIALSEASDRFAARFAAFEDALQAEGGTLPAEPEARHQYWLRVKL